MAQAPGGVVNLQRIADGSGVLAPQERAVRLPVGWTVVDHPNDSLAAAPEGPGQLTGYLELVPPGSTPPLIYTATATTTDATTATNTVTLTIPTGYSGWVRLVTRANIPSTGHGWVAEIRVFVRNPGGTPFVSTGTYSPTGGVVATVDETSGTISGSNIQAPVLAPNTLTQQVKGVAATTIHWTTWAEVVLLPE